MTLQLYSYMIEANFIFTSISLSPPVSRRLLLREGKNRRFLEANQNILLLVLSKFSERKREKCWKIFTSRKNLRKLWLWVESMWIRGYKIWITGAETGLYHNFDNLLWKDWSSECSFYAEILANCLWTIFEYFFGRDSHFLVWLMTWGFFIL